jgi:transcriptional regulator GlxA family with amidase domain
MTYHSTSWVEINHVARLYPRVQGMQVRYCLHSRDGSRKATVADVAHALNMPAHLLAQRLRADELQRLAAGK